MKKFLLSLAALLAVVGSLRAQDSEVLYTCLFGAGYNQSKVSSYTASFTTVNDGSSWTVANFNNNNSGWAYVKCGSKNAASVASITTDFLAPQYITQVVVTIDAITASSVNSISLLTSDAVAGTYTEVESKTTGLAKGELTFTLLTPKADLAYQLKFDCKKGSSNGLIQVSKVEYYGYEEQGNPDLEPAGISFSESEVAVIRGESYTLPTFNNPNDLDATFTSSDESVATVDAKTGVVTILGVGTTTIEATTEETDKFNAGVASYILTVSLHSADIAFEGNGVVNYNVDLGETFSKPTFYNPNNLSVTFSSSDEAVATVDAEGNITLGTTIGMTTIKASFEGNDEYEAAEAAYTITLLDPNAAILNFKDLASFTAGTGFNIGKATVTIDKGAGSNAPVLNSNLIRFYSKNTITVTAPEGYKLDEITFTTSGNNYSLSSAEADKGAYDKDAQTWKAGTDEITEVTITNTNSSQARISEISIRYSAIDNTRQPAGISFEHETIDAIYGEEVPENKFSNPNNLTITWTSSNEDVATVDEDGTITIVNAGTTTITASSVQTDEFKAGEASYTLTVVREFKAASIAELNELVAADASAEYIVNFPLTVTYTNGSYTYLTDGTDFMLIYQNNLPYTALDVIPAGWTANYKVYNGLPEFSIVGTAPAAEAEKGSFSPRTITVEEASELKNIGEVVIIKNVKFTENTPANHTAATADGITFYNQFGLASVAAATYDVECVVSIHGTDYQFFPIEYTAVAPNISDYILKVNGEEITEDSGLKFSDVATIEFPEAEGITFFYKWVATEEAAYIRALAEDEDGFTPYTEPFSIDRPGELSYYAQDDATGAKSEVKTLAFDIETGISTIDAMQGDAEYFNLRGEKVANPEKGIYIRVLNGKTSKVILK